MALVPKRKLPRLKRHNYTGHAVVFWTLTLENRSRGWLTHNFHSKFREMMLHVAAREQLFCPVYCLMPDHIHFVWMGLRITSDQLNAIKFLRTQLEPALENGRTWQHQAYRSRFEGRRTPAKRICQCLFLYSRKSGPCKISNIARTMEFPWSNYPWLSEFASVDRGILGNLLEALRSAARAGTTSNNRPSFSNYAVAF